MKFIESHYNKENGHSTVVMQHLGKKFIGEAKFNPEDETGASEFAGCAYAEARACIKAYKYELELARIKVQEARDFVKSCECYNNFDKESSTAKVLYRQLNQREKRVKDLTQYIEELKMSLNASIKARYNKIKKLQEKKDKEG